MESFNFYISGGGGNPKPYGTFTPPFRTPPHHSLSVIAGLAALQDVGDSARRKAVITWLQDNIVSLVGKEAADALGKLLERTALRDEANDFVDKALKFQILLERGMYTPDEAVQEWRRSQQKPD